MDRGVADLYAGVFNLAGVLFQAKSAAVSEVKRFRGSGRCRLKFEILDANGAARVECLPVGRGMQVGVRKQRYAGTRIEYSRSDRVEALRGDLHVNRTACRVVASDRADVPGYFDSTAGGQDRVEPDWELRAEREIAGRKAVSYTHLDVYKRQQQRIFRVLRVAFICSVYMDRGVADLYAGVFNLAGIFLQAKSCLLYTSRCV